MARIHVLESVGLNTYRVVVHDTTPGGNNPAGIAWSTAIQNAGRAITSMTEGSGAGQITTAERATVLNGTVLEGSFAWQDDPLWNNAQRNADLDLRATQLIDELQARLAAELRYFGATRS